MHILSSRARSLIWSANLQHYIIVFIPIRCVPPFSSSIYINMPEILILTCTCRGDNNVLSMPNRRTTHDTPGVLHNMWRDFDWWSQRTGSQKGCLTDDHKLDANRAGYRSPFAPLSPGCRDCRQKSLVASALCKLIVYMRSWNRKSLDQGAETRRTDSRRKFICLGLERSARS